MSAEGRRQARRELDDVLSLPTPARPVLVHGDLGGSNLLWEQSPRLRLSGVLDWDELFLGGQANDIASIAATYGWSIARRAARAVEDPERAVSEASYIKATFALQQALPAALSGDTENLDDGLDSYR
jgi:aminoglycoside phosphotransferase (APT) family kinase protein